MPPLRRKSSTHWGRRSPSGANLTIVLRFIVSGIDGLPQSRPCENDQSRVAIRPTAPADRARSMRADMSSREPIQYIWKNVCGLAATTSSTGLLANDDRPIAVPLRGGGAGDRDLAVGVHGLDAGRRDDHRQRDVLAHHGGGLVALGGGARDVRREAELPERHGVVGVRRPGLRPREQGAVDGRGQPLPGPALGLGDGLEPGALAHEVPLLKENPRNAGTRARGLRRRTAPAHRPVP